VAGLHPESPLSELRGVGPARSRALAQAGFHTLLDLLFHLPFRYEDRRQQLTIGELPGAGRFMLRGRLEGLQRVRVRRRHLSLVRGKLEDGTGRLQVVWFNRPYLLQQVEEGVEYALFGEVRRRGSHLELVNPSCEPADKAFYSGRIVPVYASIAGQGPAMLRRFTRQILDQIDWDQVADPLPSRLRQRHNLPTLAEALRLLHRPGDSIDVEDLESRKTGCHIRLSYGEFLELQIELALLRGYETGERKQHRYRFDDGTRQVLKEILPFRLTGAQRRVLKEIKTDLESPFPMLRLLQGDVGSGKTIVAAMALVMAVESGLQGALMAPTELLAEQHHRTLSRLLGRRYEIALLTRSVTETEATKKRIAQGKCQLIIGTHALIQQKVEFHRLAMAVVDEQHRFGVTQRQLLQHKGHQPDMLVMTATPIPRSLALTVYGDLASSVIDELPPGRRPVATRVVAASQRPRVYRWLREQLEKGGQAYIVLPLIEESERLAAESIASAKDRLEEYLHGFSMAVLHGRTPALERESVMREFHRGDIRALIATTVIEVGLDVPQATTMIVESGERFGLAQLHQLRGRVGRGRERSHCVVLHGKLSAEGRRRLQVFEETTDGFRIAEADLEIRGPGDLLGTRQSGLPLFRVADILRHRQWLEVARRDAVELAAGGLGREEQLFVSRIKRRALNRYEGFAGG